MFVFVYLYYAFVVGEERGKRGGGGGPGGGVREGGNSGIGGWRASESRRYQNPSPMVANGGVHNGVLFEKDGE